jgi:hypothetical protein
MPSTRIHQRRAVDDADFRGVVEASMMRIAYDVLTESPDTPHHGQRASVAESLFQGMSVDLERFTRLFAWRAVFEPAIQTQAFDAATGTIRADRIDDATIDGVIRGFWDRAALVRDDEDAA